MTGTWNAALAVLVILLVLGAAGTDDFENAQFAERELCKQLPKEEFCNGK